jgi:predicted alpha/beta-fold hydrolase
VEGNPSLAAVFTEHGGHVGFIQGKPWAPEFWAEREAARFLAERLPHP